MNQVKLVYIYWCVLDLLLNTEAFKYSIYSPTCDVAINENTILANISGITETECALTCNNLERCLTIGYGKIKAGAEDRCYLLNTDCIDVKGMEKGIRFKFKQEKDDLHWISAISLEAEARITEKINNITSDCNDMKNVTSQLQSATSDREILRAQLENTTIELSNMKLAMEDMKAALKNVTSQLQSATSDREILRAQLEDTTLELSNMKLAMEGIQEFARAKTTTQSSTDGSPIGLSSKAVDGNFNSHYENGKTCSHTKPEQNPWWSVDLGQSIKVVFVTITNRGNCCAHRLREVKVYVSSDSGNPNIAQEINLCAYRRPEAGLGETIMLLCKTALIGRYVIIQLEINEILTMCEVQVFGYNNF